MIGPDVPFEDAELLRELRDALESAGPISDEMTRTAQGSFAWLGVDADLELAALVFDSLHDRQTAVRGPADTDDRRLVFDGATASLELEVDGDALIGRLSPPQQARVSVMHPDRTVEEYDTDAHGEWEIVRPASTAILLTCRNHTLALSTGWLRI